MAPESFRKFIAAEDTSFGKKLLRIVLRIGSLFYSSLIAIRNLSYNKGWLKSYQVSMPVISIGNITTGGTGKTPLVIWLSQLLSSRQIPFAVLTRGYKVKKGSVSDEPAILARSCPNARVIINPDRVKAAQTAISRLGAKILIMDDGFQHRRLARDLDILTIDATCPFGYGHTLPAGLLREPLSSISRADAVVVTRCNQVTAEQLRQLEGKLRLLKPDIVIAKAVYSFLCAKTLRTKETLHDEENVASGCEISIKELRAKKIFAFCGIGNPEAFLDMLAKLQLNVVGSKVYGDHRRYNADDIDDIYEEALYLRAEMVLTTEKDWTKVALMTVNKGQIFFACLIVKLEFVDGQDKIVSLVENLC